MSETPKTSRRGFLAGAIAVGGATVAAQARAAGDPAITELQEWTQALGDGVDARPYGTPERAGLAACKIRVCAWPVAA